MSCRHLDLGTSWGNLRLIGGSRAGEGTLLMLPQLRLALDAGRPHRKLPGLSTLFISHGHADHLNALAFWASQRALNRMGGGQLLAPREIAEDLRIILEAHARMEGEADYDVSIHPLDPASSHRLRSDLRMEFFRSPHRIPTLGCRIIHSRKQLRPELRESRDEELQALRRAGQDITVSIDIPILAYAADTGPRLFQRRPDLLEAEVLLLECTFFRASDRERASEYGHLHLEDLLAAVPLLRCRHLVVLHASRRHRLREVERLLKERLRPALAGGPQLHHLVVDWE